MASGRVIDMATGQIGGRMPTQQFEIVVFDPDDHDTYPSVCAFPDEVERRFGFTGGELLLFTAAGNYVGQLVKTMEDHG